MLHVTVSGRRHPSTDVPGKPQKIASSQVGQGKDLIILSLLPRHSPSGIGFLETETVQYVLLRYLQLSNGGIS
jgi:hypothetical protein